LLHRGRDQKPGFIVDDMVQRGLTLEAGDHSIAVTVKFVSTEVAGVRVRTRSAGMDDWALLRFDTEQMVEPADRR